MPYLYYPKINLGFLSINTWGFFIGLAFVAGLFYVLCQKKANPIDILNLSLLGFFGALIGASVFYFLLFGYFGGFVFYGGLFGGLLVGWIYIKKRKLDFWRIADLVAPAVALGIFIGRLGCFLIKDHPGAVTKLPWGVLWPDGIIRHPVALYLSLNGLVLFFILSFLRSKKGPLQRDVILREPKATEESRSLSENPWDSITPFSRSRMTSGYLFIIFLTYYSITRFLLDFFRAGDPRWLGLTIGQLTSIGLFVIVMISILKTK